MKKEHVRVGIGVIVLRLNKKGKAEVLLGKRKGLLDKGQWGLPGGKPEMWEAPEECAAREMKEEVGMTAPFLAKFDWFENRFPKEGMHYITLFYWTIPLPGEEPRLMEQDKHEKWKWFSLRRLPTPMMSGAIKALHAIRSNPIILGHIGTGQDMQTIRLNI